MKNSGSVTELKEPDRIRVDEIFIHSGFDSPGKTGKFGGRFAKMNCFLHYL